MATSNTTSGYSSSTEQKDTMEKDCLMSNINKPEDVQIQLLEAKEEDQKPKPKPRDQWSKEIEFLLASIGYCVGVGNIWRFPYLCFKNGGGAFLIPYFILIITGAVPMYFLEVIMGQYTRSGAIKIWDICPIFRGVGIGITIMMMFVNVYFIILMTWPMHFMFASLVPLFNEDGRLPWTRCDAWWNSENCRTPGEWAEANKTSDWNSNNKTVGSSLEYWNNRVLGLSKGIEYPGPPQWELVGCLILSWVCVYFCVWKGVKSSGKVVYFTACFPYVMIFCLVIRGLTLPGAFTGLLFYVKPDFSKLVDSQIWMDAGTQVFYSYAICFGCQMAMGSYNKYHRNFMKDCAIICCFNSGTSLIGGVVIFSVLVYMAHESGLNVEDVAEKGPGLAFVVYPTAVALMPFAAFWAFAFFFMLVLVGIDSQFVGVEGFVVAITDMLTTKYALKKNVREWITLAVCVVSCLFGISMVTKGGFYMFNLWDYYSATGLVLFWFCFWECIAFSWGYGVDNIYDHIEDMVGYRINPWLKICWKYITPGVILILFAYSIIQYNFASLGDYKYPMWANLMGIAMGVCSTIFVPLYFLYSILIAPGNKVYEKFTQAKMSILEDFSERKSNPPNQKIKQRKINQEL